MLYPLKTAENLKCFLWFSGDIKGEPLPEMSKVAATNKNENSGIKVLSLTQTKFKNSWFYPGTIGVKRSISS